MLSILYDEDDDDHHHHHHYFEKKANAYFSVLLQLFKPKNVIICAMEGLLLLQLTLNYLKEELHKSMPLHVFFKKYSFGK